MKPLAISPSRARSIVLHAAGLSKRTQFGKGKEAVYKFIQHLGFLQIDSNYVVERAHHHSIWSRVPDYQTEWLFELQDEGKIYEFWTFASGFMPMENFRFSYPVKEALAARRKITSQKEANLMNQILDRISREGPLLARNFENDRETRSTGWWDWRPSKVALERLHSDGRLISTRRRDFQKLYDLTDNVIPSDIDKTHPTPEEFARHIIISSLRTWGIGYVKDVAYRGRYVKGNVIRPMLKKLVDNGEVCPVEVEGLRSGPLFMLPDYEKRKIPTSNEVFILSPFDVMNVLRHRLKDFFAFDYQVECFVPEKKRRYGYFALPILSGDRFIARMDAKADRKQGVLVVNYLHFDAKDLADLELSKLAHRVREFVTFNGCVGVSFKRCNNKNILQQLAGMLDDLAVRNTKKTTRSKH